MVYGITAIILILYFVLCWFAATWLGLSGMSLWLCRGLLALIGAIGAGAFLWFYRAKKKSEAGDLEAAGGEELDQRIHEGLRRLRAALGGRKAGFGEFPLVFFLGESGATKTSLIRNSGLDADLLSGLVEQDGAVVPTRWTNLFFTRQAVFVDVAGGMLAQPGAMHRLLRRLVPPRFSGALRKSAQASRSVVVCFDAEGFLKRSSEQIAGTARTLNRALQNISQQLGINFAVYVVFARTDMVGGFTEYVRNLTKEEATQVLGATLPARSSQAGGVYAEEETKRLTKAFDELCYSLAEKRIEFLSRENDASKYGDVYEFPRNMRKLRGAVVQFLVDVCRPSHMPMNPFLRGFYFTGVRPIVVNDLAPAAAESAAPAAAAGGGATRMFRYSDAAAAAAPAPVMRSAGTTRVPQWAFVTHLLNDVILRDRAAMAASGFSTRVSLMRRILLVGATAICLLLSVGLLVSYVNNRELENSVAEAARAIPTDAVPAGMLPSVDVLQRLDTLRTALVNLAQYQREGAPWRLRFGLYSGDSIYPQAKRIYFARFRPLLFTETQDQLLNYLRRVPAAPDPAYDYGTTYDTLKAYLITTSAHQYSSVSFLAPVLYARYAAGREVDAARALLIRQQFEFYSDQLKSENPYSGDNDAQAIARTRAYLRLSTVSDRVYRNVLTEGNNKNPAINFNAAVPGSREVIYEPHLIPGAFTKGGYATVQSAIRNLSNYLKGEEWVLGTEVATPVDVPRLQVELGNKYTSDFIGTWRDFVHDAAFQSFRSAADASNKLQKLSGPASPILALVATASDNTAVDSVDVANVFKPTQAVVPPGAPTPVQESNRPYLAALGGLQGALDAAKASPQGASDPAVSAQILQQVQAGSNAVQQLMLSPAWQPATRLTPDQQQHVGDYVAGLLQSPFRSALAITQRGGVDALNQAGGAFCDAFDTLVRKYPFNLSADRSASATLEEFNTVFAPGKKFWGDLYQGTPLAKLIVKQGTTYAPAPSSGSVRLNPDFVRFFRSVASFSESVYPNGSTLPHLTYSLQEASENMEGLTTWIDGRGLTAPGARQQFEWPGTSQGVQLSSKSSVLPQFPGVWGIFAFMNAPGMQWKQAGTGYALDLPIESAGQKIGDLRYTLEIADPSVFRHLPGGRCVRPVTH
ncbi:MAG TPA: ImcF-related family protein [Terriglobales bacterium]|nr:ImcF-related family protein [Terriglobales bacterium]